MKITVLGIYGGYPFNGVPSSSYLVQDSGFNLLLDAGSGSLLSLEENLDPLQLDAVLLSHYHHDHAADIGVLQYYWQLNSGEKKHPILDIYGHAQDPINFATLTLPQVTQGKVYQDYETLNLGPFKINFLRTIHPVPTYAIRIENQSGEVLVYTGDTAYFDGLVDFAADADLLIADTNFAKDKTGRIWHMTSVQSATLARNARVKKLLLSHLPQEVSFTQILSEASVIYSGAMIAEKGMKIDITNG